MTLSKLLVTKCGKERNIEIGRSHLKWIVINYFIQFVLYVTVVVNIFSSNELKPISVCKNCIRYWFLKSEFKKVKHEVIVLRESLGISWFVTATVWIWINFIIFTSHHTIIQIRKLQPTQLMFDMLPLAVLLTLFLISFIFLEQTVTVL